MDILFWFSSRLAFWEAALPFSSLPCGLQLVDSFQVLQHFGRRRSHFSFLSSDTQSVPSPQSPTQQTDDTDVNISSFVGFSDNFFLQSSYGLTNSAPEKLELKKKLFNCSWMQSRHSLNLPLVVGGCSRKVVLGCKTWMHRDAQTSKHSSSIGQAREFLFNHQDWNLIAATNRNRLLSEDWWCKIYN